MKRIIVIGSPGSGKSTFSRELNRITNIPLYYLDMLFWREDKSHVDRGELIKRIKEVFREDTWIIDGNYGATLKLRLDECDTVFFLDYPLEVCLSGIKERKGKKREDMPWIEPLEDDNEFIDYVKDFAKNQVPEIREILKNYKDKDIIVFTSREEGDEYLERLRESYE